MPNLFRQPIIKVTESRVYCMLSFLNHDLWDFRINLMLCRRTGSCHPLIWKIMVQTVSRVLFVLLVERDTGDIRLFSARHCKPGTNLC